jgi:ammonia channel protein AmtB
MATNNSSLFGGNSSSFFGNDGQPIGSHFKDPILVAAIAVNGTCAISFGALGIATWQIKRKREKGRRLFGVVSGIIAGMFLLVSPLIDTVKYEVEFVEMLTFISGKLVSSDYR